MRRVTLFLLVLISICSTLRAADFLTPGLLKLSIYTNIAGSAVGDLIASPEYPASPGEVRHLRSFNTRDAAPNDVLQDFGGRIEGFIRPIESGDYTFFLRSDAQSELWLGTDDTENSALLIAQELDRGDPFMEPDTADLATSAPVTLTEGTRYFIMVFYKGASGGGNSTDFAQVAWRKGEDTTPARLLKPIHGAFLSTMTSDTGAPSLTISNQPDDVTAEENKVASFVIEVTPAPSTNMTVL